MIEVSRLAKDLKIIPFIISNVTLLVFVDAASSCRLFGDKKRTEFFFH